MQKTKNSLVWFRNDLRVNDNAVLAKACNESDSVIAVYCLDPRHFEQDKFGFKKTEKFRAKFLLETLNDLKENLAKKNIDLLVYFDKPEAALPQLCDTYEIDAVYFQNEWTEEEKTAENTVASRISAINKNIIFHSVYNQFLYHPADINFEIDKTPQVFTVFRKKLEKYVDIRAEVHIEKKPDSNRIENTTQIPTLSDLGFEDFETHPHSAFPFKGGESEAFKRLENYFFETKKLGFYKKTRNGLVGVDYSSKFSPWLANGSISARTIYWQIKKFEAEHFKNQSTYWLIFELIWRDYFKYVSLKHGNQIFKLEGILKKDYAWSRNQNKINAWINGETHSDFVNANMIELKETGWMSNRGRQNVASYFAKELELDWRIGAAYFESLLLDYDVHSNYGNWMYVAGVGNDPRDRKFNVDLQAERYDTNGKFRKRWLQTSLF
ncbi:deoxyribodipyrimidine photo-lyase (single-stranded DNA-specific) [Winogradskyella wandonensis]|uniref:Cryptochrome DASH n=1 Tax=Winogradskyella wandonensis TaxID=1442586 RepID=A0A4R1KJC8_9FLAO|nr:DASH family cryptochrome [Winogradskyella wandonensis]TCK64875.1 deoxyribodipyrimidine photo-lyase (single-stranded DNA-specific) [Winogradskyella wandonensis]